MDLVIQQKLLTLQQMFDANPVSRGALSSKSNYVNDVCCKCGWSLAIKKGVKPSKVMFEVRQHFAERKVKSTSRKFRSTDDRHTLLPFHLKDDQIISHQTPSVQSWLQPNLPPQPPPSTNPAPAKFVYPPTAAADIHAAINQEHQSNLEKCRSKMEAITAAVDLEHQDNMEQRRLTAESIEESVESTSLPTKAAIASEKLVRELHDATEQSMVMAQERHYLHYKESINRMENEFEAIKQTPQFITDLIWAHENGKIDPVQQAIIDTFSSSLRDAPTDREYPELTIIFFKYLSIVASETQYEILRKLMGGPCERTIRKLRQQMDILSDVGPTERNIKEAQAFFTLVR